MLAVIYLIFNEGYTASPGVRLVREDLCTEAIRLGRLLAGVMRDEPEVMGLLGLMLLIESRRETRTTSDGGLVLLADQDRGRWDRGLIAERQAIVRQCLRRNQPGPYQIQAAINAVHTDAPTAAATDWRQILQLYDQLLSLAPSPVVALHRAAVVATDAYLTEDAVDLIDVRYSPLEPVVDVQAALADGAPLLYEEFGTNLANTIHHEVGNVDAAFAQADHVYRETFEIHRYGPVPMETRGVVAEAEPGTGRITLWTCTPSGRRS